MGKPKAYLVYNAYSFTLTAPTVTAFEKTVSEEIPWAGRKFDSYGRVWTFYKPYTDKAREIVNAFYDIAGDSGYAEHKSSGSPFGNVPPPPNFGFDFGFDKTRAGSHYTVDGDNVFTHRTGGFGSSGTSERASFYADEQERIRKAAEDEERRHGATGRPGDDASRDTDKDFGEAFRRTWESIFGDSFKFENGAFHFQGGPHTRANKEAEREEQAKRYGGRTGTFFVPLIDPTHFATLGCSPADSKETVSAAYKKLALANHPDRNKSPDALKKMQSVNAAWTTIKKAKGW